MSSLLSSGGGRAYRLESLGLEIIKSPSTSWLSNSSSPSSTLSESSNCPLAISTRKPRTPRKRPNQTYNEAAALLSTAYPKVFPTKHLMKSPGSNNSILCEPEEDLFMPLLHPSLLELSHFSTERKGFNHLEKPCFSPGEINSRGDSSEVCDEYTEDFDAESILDEEIEEGIDSIMGNMSMDNEPDTAADASNTPQINNFCYGYPVGYGFGYAMKSGLRAIRNADEGDWWNHPCVNFVDITPKPTKTPPEKKKKKKIEAKGSDTKPSNPKSNKGNPAAKAAPEEAPPPYEAGLILKLNYDSVLREWSDKGSPFSGDSPGSEPAGNDVHARLAQIDLFSENNMREASMMRYKEKRRTRLFSKKIRYQVRKVNADRRPRIKGRFVRSPDD